MFHGCPAEGIPPETNRKPTRRNRHHSATEGLPKFQISPAELSRSSLLASKDRVRHAPASPARNVAGLQFCG
jgi:hypothetical protein